MRIMPFLLPFIVYWTVCNVPSQSQPIKLESDIIKLADGAFIDADTIEFIRGFRRTLLTFLLGEELPNGKRKGLYEFSGHYYDIKSLAILEKELSALNDQKSNSAKQALRELLVHAKADFLVKSKKFIEGGRGAKGILIVLIQEDCKKRNRPASLLLEWAKTKEGLEASMFEKQITSFELYYYFCTDLVNFLLDLTHSCPKAEQHFKDRVAKWSTVKEILPLVLKKAHLRQDQVNEAEFLKYLKERYLDHMAIDEITIHVVTPLLIEYLKHRSIPHAN